MAKECKVPIRYTGQAHRRVVEHYEWNADNGFVQTVTSQVMVERLLANGDFELVQAPDTTAAQRQQEQQE